MTREMGTAFAVLALYVLTLLLPLHQAAGLQRDLNAVGYSTLEAWSVCQPMAADENGDPASAAALTCPAAGIAKHQFTALVPPVLVIEPPTTSDVIRFAEAYRPHTPILPDHVGQSRAPPVAV